TALIGFSQGAIMALEFSIAHEGGVGRVLSFSGRFATLPEKAPELTTLHLLHGENDSVIPVAHAYAAYARLTELQGDATLDIASSVGHEIHTALVDRAINRLQTCIPLRSWQQALKGA
ncbi:MAG: esterase, partial [Gallionella sp.]